MYQLSKYDVTNDGSISTNVPENIQDVSQIYPYVNARDAILKTRDCIKKMQSEWKG